MGYIWHGSITRLCVYTLVIVVTDKLPSPYVVLPQTSLVHAKEDVLFIYENESFWGLKLVNNHAVTLFDEVLDS